MIQLRTRLALTMTSALLSTVFSVGVFAESPEHPVKIHRKSAPVVPLETDIDIDSRVITDAQVTSEILSAGKVVWREELPSHRVVTPKDKSKHDERINGPKAATEALGPGVYARNVRITSAVKGEPGKGLGTVYTDYFKVDNGVVTMLTSTEYTNIVQPLEDFPDGAGKTVKGRAGAASAPNGPPIDPSKAVHVRAGSATPIQP